MKGFVNTNNCLNYKSKGSVPSYELKIVIK